MTSNIPVQIQLPQRRRNVTHKLGRLYSLGHDEIDKFTSEINKNLNLSQKYSYPKILEIINTSIEYTKEAESIINTLEAKHGIKTGENLLEESNKHENKLAWVIEYPESQLKNWINNKIDRVCQLCKSKEVAINRIKILVDEDFDMKNINKQAYTIPTLNIEKILDSQHKKILINILIKCTVGYTIRCTGILA